MSERPDDLGALVEHIDGYLCEVKDIQVKDGLHVLGTAPSGEQLRGLVSAMLRLGSGDVPGLRRAVGAAFGLDEPALVAAPGAPAPAAPVGLLERFRGPAGSAGDVIDRLESAQAALLDALAQAGWTAASAGEVCARVLGLRDAGVERALRFAAEVVVPRIAATDGELRAVLGALDGRHVPSGPSGSPTRGRVDVLPTGRNFYSVDPRALPSELSWETGQRLAQALLRPPPGRARRSCRRMVGLVAWGTSAMRTQGDDVAEILALLGVRPVWARESRRVTGIEVVSLEELGRPRIDVTVRISGFFRDAFPHLVRLLDDAFAAVAALDEPPESNFVAAHAREDAERLAGELGTDDAWRRATTRIFGSKPGAYGAGLLQLLDARDWRDDGDIAEVYEAWGGYAYGRGLDGAQARSAMRDCFARIDVAVKNVDSRENDILDSDDYYQYHGGMVAAVRAISGREPDAVLGDSSDPSRVVTRSLGEETRRVFRARVANPRWIASMIRHGYKGAAELAATVDYLFGYDATTGVAEDWMYERLAERYLLDADVAALHGPLEPVGRALDRRAAAGGGRARHVGGARGGHARRGPRALPGARGRARGGAGVIPAYPFSAIVGQEGLLEALLVNAVSPEVGGVLVRGERGTAKSTAVRGARAAAARRPGRRRPGVLLRARRPRARRGRSRPARRSRSAPPRSSSCRSARRSTGSSARSTSDGRWPASAPSRPGCWPARTAACSTSTRSTCCPTTSSTSCSTPRRWASATSSATRSPSATTRASCSSAR